MCSSTFPFKAFANYQLQQMAPEFLDSMGFDEDHFPESDDDMKY